MDANDAAPAPDAPQLPTDPALAAPPAPRGRRRKLLLLLAIVAGGAALSYGWVAGRRSPVVAPALKTAPSSPEPAATPRTSALLSIDSGDIRYSYHLLTGWEGLFDLRLDPECQVNLIEDRAEVAEQLRRELATREGVGHLDDLRAAEREKIERLRGLGYL